LPPPVVAAANAHCHNRVDGPKLDQTCLELEINQIDRFFIMIGSAGRFFISWDSWNLGIPSDMTP
jgi:hypothetical protein